jgi:outer membrane protein OmpA-like peptidoglycan-associated protein
MRRIQPGGRWITGTLLAVIAGVGSAACSAKVDQDVFDREIAALRGDVSGLDGRMTANEEQIAAMNVRLDVLETELDELRKEFDVTVTRLETGIRFATPVHFEFDRAEIRPQDRELLNRFAAVMSHHFEGALVTIEGFADPAGAAAYNQQLSERRARSVAAYLQSEGRLPSDMLRTVGYGENRQVQPGAHGPGSAGMANRRVTFAIEYAPGEAPAAMTASAEG